MKIFLSFLFILGGCSFKKNPLENQTSKGHNELYSEPSAPKLAKLESDEERVVIASTNDVHGKYESEVVTFKDNHNKNEFQMRLGGRKVISAHLSILRDTYKKVVLVDSGDLFSSADKLSEVSNFYETHGYDALTIGLRDFNLKVPSDVGSNTKLFQNFAKSSKVPLLLTNLFELKTARVVEWPGTKPHFIKEVGGVKVGILGLVPNDIVAQTPVNNRVGLFVENMLQSTMRHARLLRSLGAELIVVMTHQGIDCGTELASETKLPLLKVNFEPMRENVCDLDNALGQYLERLPPQLVDVVIGGRSQQKIANFVNGTLVMSGFPDGKSLSFAEFTINKKNKKIVPEKTVVHQPVLFCHEFFSETKDCFHVDETVNHKKKIPAKFLGKEIEGEPLPVGEATATKMSPLSLEAITKSLVNFNADLSFVQKQNSGETQLFVLSIPGRELRKVLEADYNHDKKDHWLPSPFLFKDSELSILVSGLQIEVNKQYRILTDLESVQKHPALVKLITSSEAQALMNHSWGSLEEDAVNTQLAAQER